MIRLLNLAVTATILFTALCLLSHSTLPLNEFNQSREEAKMVHSFPTLQCGLVTWSDQPLSRSPNRERGSTGPSRTIFAFLKRKSRHLLSEELPRSHVHTSLGPCAHARGHCSKEQCLQGSLVHSKLNHTCCRKGPVHGLKSLPFNPLLLTL